MKQKIFLGLGIFLLTILGVSVYSEFMANHTYYNSMFASRDNRKMIIWMVISAAIPMAYIIWNKFFSIKNFLLKWLPVGLIVSSTSYLLLKDSIFGSTGFIILCLNTLLIYVVGLYFLGGLLSIGTRISDKRIKFDQMRRQEMAMNFGIGLGVFLLLMKALLMLDMLYPVVTRIIFISFGIALYLNRKKLSIYGEIVNNMMSGFQKNALAQDRTKRIGVILIVIAIVYYFYGFQLSFIPYSTAWDANHEYMYIPKVLAENHGVLRGNNGPGANAPMLWHSLLSFRFSLSESIPHFRLGQSTLPVAINFLAGPLSLLLGIGVIQQILTYFKKKNEDSEEHTFAFYLGRFLLLLRLTSGMGAFLVFVDNKTDLGVMCITILALLGGFIFLEYLKHHNTKDGLKNASKYIITSGVFFALASMSKQTAFIDIALFALIMIALWFNTTITIGIGTLILGVTGIMGIANAKDILPASTGMIFSGIGLVITIIGILQLIRNQKKGEEKTIIPSLKHLGIWAGSIIIIILVFKGSHLIYTEIRDGIFTPGTFARNIILGKNNSTLLASNETPTLLNVQATVDQNNKSNLSPALCAQTKFSTGELAANTKKAVVSNEDVGRYVGYGRKELKPQGRSAGYALLKLFFLQNNKCYGINHDAKILCENGISVDNFDVKTLKPLLAQMNSGSDAYTILNTALTTFTKKGYAETSTYNPQEFRDQIVSLRTYYQSHAIKAVDGTLSIPYRYIIPLNISFNRSLQNLSSYYTDIGFIRVFAMGLIILGFIYGLLKKDDNLVTVTSVTIIGWSIWRVIGGGILRYGMGLIVRTILGTIMFVAKLSENQDDSESTSLTFIFFLGLLSIRGILQLFFNLIRISSQGVGGPFARYRMNIGQTIEFDTGLQQTQTLKNGYAWKDVFNLQFPHYNKFINYVENRKNEDGVLVAGTYIQYFLKNQWNINLDGMLSNFWELASDGDSCKSAQRLKNANIKYLVIDPNIGTVGMGEGNESLFQRFFAKLDPISGKIETQGAISMLIKMNQDGFLKLLNTNNLGAKYAFTLDDATISAGLSIGSGDLILARAKLSVARYFSDADKYIQFIAQTLSKRISDGLAIGDIADVLGKNIDEAKVMNAAKALINNSIKDEAGLATLVTPLTQDERYILAQYVGIYKMASGDQTQFQQAISSVISQSLGSSSQLMTFEVMQ